MKHILSRLYETKGQLATVLNLFLAVFLVLAIGLFSFELSRYFLARDELKTNVEAAALCCETALVSSGNPSDSTNQTNAQNAALQLFKQNSILGQTMASASFGTLGTKGTPQFDVQAGQAQIYFQFLNPVPDPNTGVRAAGGTNGTLIDATGAYCYSPAFGQLIGLSNIQFTFQVSALSGVPTLDIIIAYDISGSEDFQTPVTFVQRYWDQYGTEYLVPNTQSTGSNGGGGTIGGGCNPPPNPYINPLPPGYLDTLQNCQNPPYNYAEQSGNNTVNLTGQGQAYQAPPGNYQINGSTASTTTTGSKGALNSGFLPDDLLQEQLKIAQSKSNGNKSEYIIYGQKKPAC